MSDKNNIDVLSNKEVETKINIIRANKVTDNFNTFDDFFYANFEKINFKKKYIGSWIGWKYKNDNPDLFDISVRNVLLMCYIDLKYNS